MSCASREDRFSSAETRFVAQAKHYVATWRNADSRSGASVPRARQAPLNSSISETNESISKVIFNEDVLIIPRFYTHLHPIIKPETTPIERFVIYAITAPTLQQPSLDSAPAYSVLPPVLLRDVRSAAAFPHSPASAPSPVRARIR